MFVIAGRIVALAAAGLLALAGVAVAAPSGQYGGPTSQKVGGSPLRIAVTVTRGALANVSVDAVLEQGGAACSLTGADGSSYDFSRGAVRIDRQGKFAGTLKDPDRDSMKISGRFTGHAAAGSIRDRGARNRAGNDNVRLRKGCVHRECSGRAGEERQVLPGQSDPAIRSTSVFLRAAARSRTSRSGSRRPASRAPEVSRPCTTSRRSGSPRGRSRGACSRSTVQQSRDLVRISGTFWPDGCRRGDRLVAHHELAGLHRIRALPRPRCREPPRKS